MSLIVTNGLTKQYGGRITALAQLTVDVPPGVVGLVGANGAGKSTLIKILLGLSPATAGTAKVLDLDVATEGPRIREIVGYMPEHDCLPPDVSATELVVHLARMSGLPMTAARERAADTLRHVGLYEERYRPIGGYSTGMKQRVKLAQALVHDPQLVLLDEPTNGLDPAGRDEMLGLIRRIGSVFGISVVVTSHLMGELERVCDHVVVGDVDDDRPDPGRRRRGHRARCRGRGQAGGGGRRGPPPGRGAPPGADRRRHLRPGARRGGRAGHRAGAAAARPAAHARHVPRCPGGCPGRGGPVTVRRETGA